MTIDLESTESQDDLKQYLEYRVASLMHDQDEVDYVDKCFN